MEVANAQAYYDRATITAVKRLQVDLVKLIFYVTEKYARAFAVISICIWVPNLRVRLKAEIGTVLIKLILSVIDALA